MHVHKELENHAVETTDAAGRPVRVLSLAGASAAGAALGMELPDVVAAALRAGIWPKWYLRNQDAISLGEQVRLAESSVAIAGAGGLGGHVILQLARLGVGRLHVMDGDVFDETNLNRQLLADRQSLGRNKAETAALAVSLVNPAVRATAYPGKIRKENAAELLSGMEVVVDALDNIPDRFMLADAARSLSLPLVHGAVAGFEGRIMTILPEDQGFRLLYGEDAPTGQQRQPSAEAILGTPVSTPAVIAGFQVMEVLKILLRKGGLFRNRMAHIRLDTGQINEFRW
ncbi:MAG: HesA/MoeB/ThiF family protein [Thermodesulfobacteriota bacterium]